MGEIGTFFSRRRTLLEQNQLAVDECLTLAQRLIDNVVEPASPAAWDSRFDALVRFPADAWSALPTTFPEVAAQPSR